MSSFFKVLAASVVKDLRSHSTPERAKSSAWFFKTAKGQYGYGDVFIGVTVPEQRSIAKLYKDLPLVEIEKLLQNKIHECHLTALIILVNQFAKADEKTRKTIVHFYLSHTKWINNWDLVDSSARYIVGEYLHDKKDRKVLYTLVKSENIWERRISIVATHAFIMRGDFADTIKIAELLLQDEHDLIHKATGWMLREMGKRSVTPLREFLNTHAHYMPRTALRYAIERLPESERKGYLYQKNIMNNR